MFWWGCPAQLCSSSALELAPQQLLELDTQGSAKVGPEHRAGQGFVLGLWCPQPLTQYGWGMVSVVTMVPPGHTEQQCLFLSR